MRTKPAATREQVYAFAKAAIDAGRPAAAAAAVICFEWLQRPENVLAGFVRWTDYRGREAPNAVRIEHHKTGAVVLHPLVDPEDGSLLYEDAEAVLARVPRCSNGPETPAGRHDRAIYGYADGQNRGQGADSGRPAFDVRARRLPPWWNDRA
jgi:hypothetical protein